jgi:hypothetical protein
VTSQKNGMAVNIKTLTAANIYILEFGTISGTVQRFFLRTRKGYIKPTIFQMIFANYFDDNV